MKKARERQLAPDHSAPHCSIIVGLEANVTTCHERKDSVGYVAWSPDGTRIASASNDKTVHV